jgi:tRNA-specific adenosine deaminase 3
MPTYSVEDDFRDKSTRDRHQCLHYSGSYEAGQWYSGVSSLQLESLLIANYHLGSVVRKLIPNDGGLDLQHLRRFAKHDNIPEHVRASFSAARTTATTDEDARKALFLIIGSTNALPKQTVIETLSSTITNVTICSIQVPLLAPTSQEQAALWTSKYWPTVYKKSNPFGPHPSIVSRAEEEIQRDVAKWMRLAAEVAQQSSIKGFGEAVGIVIVERRNGITRPIAVAGDARWLDWPPGRFGNVTAHAALRAIAMVAEGLKSREVTEFEQYNIADKVDIFQGKPILAIEKDNYDASGNENGYLCHELEIYCTHEPCVMCSMAIVHSRFSRVVFENQMSETGGLCADGELGHGLFWRKELNWTLLAWQYVRSGEGKRTILNLDLNA